MTTPLPLHAALIDQFKGLIGPEHVLTEPGDRAPYEHEMRGLFPGDAIAVLRPGSTADVAACVRAAAREPHAPFLLQRM
ncbi:MAG TPA: hydroxyacid dehydrogenase, partial [Beijerinckiaceae bacterium]|nr:hydroxyacid dehydrogenase [Beijerinckiaceae bacterium]